MIREALVFIARDFPTILYVFCYDDELMIGIHCNVTCHTVWSCDVLIPKTFIESITRENQSSLKFTKGLVFIYIGSSFPDLTHPYAGCCKRRCRYTNA